MNSARELFVITNAFYIFWIKAKPLPYSGILEIFAQYKTQKLILLKFCNGWIYPSAISSIETAQFESWEGNISSKPYTQMRLKY